MRTRCGGKTWVLGILAVVAIAAGVLLFSLLGGGDPGYYTVAQIVEEPAAFNGETVNVRGVVKPGSVSWDEETQTTVFTLADDGAGLDIFYIGMPPDAFGAGADILVVGTLDDDGVLKAYHIREPGTMCALCH